MPSFDYSAEEIEQLTGGHLVLKSLNNWVTKNFWLTEIERPTRGRARRFSRANVLEAVLASKMMLAGIPRGQVKGLLKLLAAHRHTQLTGKTAGFVLESVALLFDDDAFHTNDGDWYLALSFLVKSGKQHLDQMKLLKTTDLPEWLQSTGGHVVIISITEVVKQLEALGIGAGTS